MKRKLFIGIALVVFSILQVGCSSDTIDLTNMPDPDRKLTFAGPIAKVQFTMQDIIDEFFNDTILSVGDDGLISRSFRQEVKLNWESLVKIDDIHYTKNYLPLPASQLKSVASITLTEKFRLNPDNARYDSLTLNNGLLDINLTAPNQATGTIHLTIPEIRLSNGQILTYTLQVTNTVKTFHETLNLNAAKIYPKQATDSSYVTLVSDLSLTYNPAAGVPGPVQMSLNISSMQSGLTFGYFGQSTQEKMGMDVSFDFYDGHQSVDNIELADVELQLITENYIGTPFSIEIDSMWFSHDSVQNPLRLDFYDTNVFDITSARYANPIVPVVQTFKLNSSNSNILAITNSHPNYVICNITGTSNPHNTGVQNFLSQENNLHSTLVMNFPFWFRSDAYNRLDTINFDFNDMVDDPKTTDPIDSMIVYLDFYNGLPLDFSAQAYVIDTFHTVIDSLLPYNQSIVKSGIIDTNGKVIKQTHSELISKINQEQIQNFRNQNAKYIILSTRGITADDGNTFVKIFNDNVVDISVSVDMKGKIVTK